MQEIVENLFFLFSGWSGVMPNAAPTTAPPPGFSHPFRVASRAVQPMSMEADFKSLLNQIH
jgi:hypothetical protein